MILASTLTTNLAILVLAGFIGFVVISKVPNTLHTPLMSGTNAIHGIVLLGGLLIIGLAGNDVLRRQVEPVADDVRVRRAEANAAAIRRYTETRYGAKSWHADRRVAARIEATAQGLDIRYVVTSFTHGSAEWLYDSLYFTLDPARWSREGCDLRDHTPS